jgi:sulfopropanediol 3-dehydrogenase
MTTTYLKKATQKPETGEQDVRDLVASMLPEIEEGGEAKVREIARKLDG